MKLKGTVHFQGDHLALLHQIDIAGGTLGNSQKFQCCFDFPRRFCTRYSRLSFLFSCHYTETENGYVISYRVFPTFRSGILLLLSIMMLIYAICSLVNGSVMGLAGSLLLASAIFFLYTVGSACCIRNFIQFFKEKAKAFPY